MNDEVEKNRDNKEKKNFESIVCHSSKVFFLTSKNAQVIVSFFVLLEHY